MSGDFIIEESFGAVDGIARGKFLILAQNQVAGLMAAEAAVNVIGKVKGSITPFPGGVVAAPRWLQVQVPQSLHQHRLLHLPSRAGAQKNPVL
ncbi:MAG: hypothetical protein GX463_11650 [Methanothrix sp.]|nr:hypothetical protein [Methanothrix sp.]